MIPQLIVSLTAFPLTPNQKVDRRSLAEWNISAMHTEETLHTPKQPIERLLAALWKRTLGVTAEDKHSNFFRLGGHSIKAMELAGYINEHFDSGVGLKDIFENPTIEKQAELLSARGNASIDVIPLTLPAIHYEVAPAQRMIWLACQRPVISAAYNMYAIFSVAGHFSQPAMEMAVQQIINRHEILRTNFIEVAGTPRQKIQTGDNPLFNIQQVEIVHSEDVDAFVADIVTTPFDLESALLLKAFLIRIADGRQLFVFITHHLILDGWSLEIFVKEALAAYRGILHEKTLPFQYRDYAVWSNKRLREPATRLCIAYWQEVLRDFVPVETFKRTGNEQSFCGNKIYTGLGQTISNSLYAKASEMDMSVFNMLLAAVHALIGRVAKQYDFCTGIPVAGRGHPQLHDLLGMFVNTILIRSQLTIEDSFESICRNVREVVFQSMDYQDLPLDELMNAQGEKNTMLFDVMVTWQHPDFNMEELKVTDDLVLSRSKFTQGGSRIPVTFNFYENEEQLICETAYDTGLFEAGQMMLLTERFRKLLQQMISQPQAPLNTLDIELELEKELRHNTVEIEFEF
jgi:surfactin family lipopeptide synthetase A